MTTTTLAPSALATILAAARKDGLRDETLQVLCLLEENDSLTMGELAARLDVTSASITGIIDSLEKRSFVRRLPSRADRRVINIEILGLGRLSLESILTA